MTETSGSGAAEIQQPYAGVTDEVMETARRTREHVAGEMDKALAEMQARGTDPDARAAQGNSRSDWTHRNVAAMRIESDLDPKIHDMGAVRKVDALISEAHKENEGRDKLAAAGVDTKQIVDAAIPHAITVVNQLEIDQAELARAQARATNSANAFAGLPKVQSEPVQQ